MLLKLSFIMFIIISSSLLLTFSIKAQDLSSGLAISVPVEGEVGAGDILCSSGESFVRCNSEYQSSMYGVVVDASSLEITDSELPNSRLVITEGIATVRVTASNGEIRSGNFITSSDSSGVAQLATKNGYVLGTALEDLTTDEGVIQAVINVNLTSSITRDGSSNLVQFIRDGLAVPVFEPLESFRYLLAAMMVIVAFGLGLAYFGKSSRAGIEAIGRNPLARNVIQFTTVMNVLLTIVIVSVGLAIAYFILIF